MFKLPSRNWLWVSSLLFLGLVGWLLVWFAVPPVHEQPAVRIPRTADWVDYGTIFEAGEPGEWDLYLYGAFAATAVKFNDTYYLYFQGAGGYRDVDETVTGRAIGVATSSDGVRFTKHPNNPVLTWSPTGNGEEGAVSSGAFVNGDEVVMIYGANTEQDATKINADARLATSTDGIHFTDQGIILGFRDETVWGAGDELFPIIAFKEADRWFVYYLPNGVLQRHRLGAAWGNDARELTQSAGVRSGLKPLSAWGTGGYARLSAEVYALILNDVYAARTDVHTVSLAAPDRLSAPVTSYQFDDYRQATVLLDEETRTWFMYYRNADQTRYGVKLAPAGPPDRTPPTAPTDLTAVPVGDQIKLAWRPASDADTGIVQYRVYREGQLQAEVLGETFRADRPAHAALYWVTAINYHGTEGPASEAVVVQAE